MEIIVYGLEPEEESLKRAHKKAQEEDRCLSTSLELKSVCDAEGSTRTSLDIVKATRSAESALLRHTNPKRNHK